METAEIVPVNQNGQEIFNLEAIKRYMNNFLPSEVECLDASETLRTVVQIQDIKNPDDKNIFTPKEPCRSAQDVADTLARLQQQNPNKNVGISISTTVFNYTGDTPKTSEFKYTNAIAIDIDTHIKGTKKRYPLNTFDDDQVYYSILCAWSKITEKLYEIGIKPVVPKLTMMTGGGLQFILGFDSSLNQEQAKSMFGLLKQALGNLVWEVSLRDALGVYSKVPHDIDKTFSDIVHVQRCSGTMNQKYGVLAKEFPLFELTDIELNALKMRLIMAVKGSASSEDQQKHLIDAIETNFFNISSIKPETDRVIPTEDVLVTAKMQRVRSTIKPSQLKSVEIDLLQKLKQQGIDCLDLLGSSIQRGPSTGNLTKIHCPFHPEDNPSMAYYRNELYDVFKDFHDDKTYSFIDIWEAIYQIPKTDAIAQIAEKAGISLGKGERKEFQNLELKEIIDELLTRVNTEEFVFYRLANKNRTCCVRVIDTGEVHVFDGPKMLSNHVLGNHLGVDDAELTLKEGFATAFQEKILIEAFEEFKPGEKTIFEKKFIKFVNLWVPSERYKRIHDRAAEIAEAQPEEFSIDETIELLKRKTPYAYKYLLQVVQNGDLPWFINWLGATSKFIPVPTVPVVFGVQGAGKNLFVDEILEFYLNNEYIKTVSGDRLMQQFNSILESTSLLVLDEGDFSNGKEIDQLKLLTGNGKILIEKKGVDATNKQRHFNILFFSNGEVPIRHPAMDRRITYFNNEIPLLASIPVWGLDDVDALKDRLKSEMVEFWAIIFRTKLNHQMTMANSKNGQFWKQILMQHPFGTLVVKLMSQEWEEIALQLNENVQDEAEVSMNLKLLDQIRLQFEKNGAIELTLINRYLHSLNFRMKQSIQKFIQSNNLHDFGIHTVIDETSVKIIVDKKRVLETLRIDNVLKRAYPKVTKTVVSSFDAKLAEEEACIAIEAAHHEEEYHLDLPPAPSGPSTN
jgi:hypothetical protein